MNDVSTPSGNTSLLGKLAITMLAVGTRSLGLRTNVFHTPSIGNIFKLKKLKYITTQFELTIPTKES